MIREKIAFVSDIHLDEQFPMDNNVDARANWERILQDIKNKNIQRIVFGGDIGDPSAHAYFFDSLKPFSVKLILGNHDRANMVSRYFWEGVDSNELFYEYEDDVYKYVFLDTSADEISPMQISWLQTSLDTPKRIVVFIHHPVLSINSPIDKMAPLKNRQYLKNLLLNSSREIVLFCGHYHMNDEMSEKNLKQITSLSSSFQLIKTAADIQVDNSRFGYRIIDFKPEGVFSQAVEFVISEV